MHFITFPVASTNIFPLSNSTKGGQLVTEYNLKSREMVATNPRIKYAVGPSFIHSSDDFKVKCLEDTDVPDYDSSVTYHIGDYCRYSGSTYICVAETTGEFDSEAWETTVISTSILQIDPGRAVINGHFVEALAPMLIDMKQANIDLRQNAQEELYGNLSIGIKSYFSTESTMAGAMLVENTDNMYVGVQIIIAKTSEFRTPNDEECLNNRDMVTADIKLADFTYLNGSVSPSSIVLNPMATRYIPSERIYDFDSLLDDKYVSSEGTVNQYFYTFSGASKDWCNATGSMMIWDSTPDQNRILVNESAGEQFVTVGTAQFLTDSHGDVYLVVPHKQLDADVIIDNKRLYYKDIPIKLPTADYTSGASGIVTKDYTQHIKDIESVITTYKQFTGGKQIGFFDTLYMDSDGVLSQEFPKDLSNQTVGDYILVREDYTVPYVEGGAANSTMYVVLPGPIMSLLYGHSKGSGLLLAKTQKYLQDPDKATDTANALSHLADFYNKTESYHSGDFAAYEGCTYKCTANTSGDWDASKWTMILDYDVSTFGFTSYRGNEGTDYFELEYYASESATPVSYYYIVMGVGSKTWSGPILLTGGVPLATETHVGGFYNASTDSQYTDAGYVYLDSTGHLRLLDYALLRSGALAYQLGEDYTVPSNQTIDYINAYLDESVNERVAFRLSGGRSTTPDMINVTMTLPAGVTSEENRIINIYNLDSRFGTGVYLHFLTEDRTADYSNIVINISDCEKIRIDNSITTLTNGPVINILRSCLYYDPEVISYVRDCDPENVVRNSLFPSNVGFTGFDNLTLWYARFTTSDPDLIVNGMEVSQPNVQMTTQDIAFWSEDIPDDNHYSYALRSITLSGSGKLISCSLYISNSTSVTAPITTTRHIIIGGDFILPQGSALNYPIACVNDPLKVTGVFTTAYRAVSGANWIVTETSFTALTGTYSPSNGMSTGSIAFNSTTTLVESTYIHADSIGAWAPGTFHIFYGGTTV